MKRKNELYLCFSLSDDANSSVVVLFRELSGIFFFFFSGKVVLSLFSFLLWIFFFFFNGGPFLFSLLELLGMRQCINIFHCKQMQPRGVSGRYLLPDES